MEKNASQMGQISLIWRLSLLHFLFPKLPLRPLPSFPLLLLFLLFFLLLLLPLLYLIHLIHLIHFIHLIHLIHLPLLSSRQITQSHSTKNSQETALRYYQPKFLLFLLMNALYRPTLCSGHAQRICLQRQETAST